MADVLPTVGTSFPASHDAYLAFRRISNRSSARHKQNEPLWGHGVSNTLIDSIWINNDQYGFLNGGLPPNDPFFLGLFSLINRFVTIVWVCVSQSSVLGELKLTWYWGHRKQSLCRFVLHIFNRPFMTEFAI